jgi:alpha-beta hydrolase superfamily lysophospholipase
MPRFSKRVERKEREDMIHEEGFFKGVRSARTYYQCWLPEGEARATLVVVHGLAEHGGRYMSLVNCFAPLGYAVYAIDHFGHGKSEGPRTYVEQFEDYTHTLRIFTTMVAQWQPDKPVILVGHSMGGLIGAVYLIEGQHPFTGAVLSAPLVKMHGKVSPILVLLVKTLSSLMPRFRLVGLDAESVSRDPDIVRAYAEDPLVYGGKTTARLAAELSKTIGRVAAEAGKITLPLLIVQGGADRLVDPDGSRMLYDRASSIDKTLKIYDGLYHEVFNEPERDVVLGDVKSWVEARLGGRQG